MFLATTALVSSVLAFGEFLLNPGVRGSISAGSWFAIGYVAVLGTAAFYFLYQYAIHVGSPVVASMILYLAPVAAFIWANVLLGERLTGVFIAGAFMILAGAWIVSRLDGSAGKRK